MSPAPSASTLTVAALLFICLFAGYQWISLTGSSTQPLPSSPPLHLLPEPDNATITPQPPTRIFHEPVCQGADSGNCPRKFALCPSNYRSARPSYPLTACIIEKSMSTFLSGIICYLYNSPAFLAANQSLNKQTWREGYCKDVNEYLNDNFSPASDYGTTLMAIVRDPIERFVSGYVNKCYQEHFCHGCPVGNLTCFVDAQYNRTLLYGAGRLDDYDLNYLDTHFFPQNWFCQFNQALKNYKIITYGSKGGALEKMADDIQKVLEGAKVESSKIEYIRSGLLKLRTNHATAGSEASNRFLKIARESEHIQQVMRRMYYHDYELFGLTETVE